MREKKDVTVLLHRFREGDTGAADELLPLVYRELRKLAAAKMKNERADHTLQPTALVHEVYLRLAGGAEVDWQNRAHFFAVAAQQMRRVMVDHARADKAEKRGGDAVVISLDDFNGVTLPRDESLIALDDALLRLAQELPRPAKVIELRYFGGLTEPETAAVLGIGVSTLKRDWEFARAWLAKQLTNRPQARGQHAG